MKRVLEIISLIFLSFCGLVFLLFLGAGVWTKLYGKTWLETELQKRFQLQVSIAAINSNFFNSLTAEKISISDPSPITIESAQLSFQPWELLNPKLAYRNMFFIEVDGLHASLSDQNDYSKFFNSDSSFHLKFPVSVILSSASIAATYQEKEYQFNDITAEIKAGGTKVQTVFKSGGGTFGPFKGKFALNLNSHKSETLIAVEKFDLGLMEAFVPPDIKQKWGTLVGEADMKFAFKNTTQWNAKIMGDNLTWKRGGEISEIPLSIDAEITPDNVSIKKLVLDDNFSVQGAVNNYRGTPDLNLDIKSKEAPIARAVAMFSPKSHLSIDRGNFSINGHLSGRSNDPIFLGEITASPVMGKVVLPPIQGKIVLENKQVDVKSNFSGGELNLDAQWSEKGLSSTHLTLNDVFLDGVSKLNNWSSVNGKIDTKLKLVMGDQGEVQFNGPIRLENFSWGRLKPKSVIQGTLDGNSHYFLLSAANDGVLVNVSINNEQVTFEDVKVNFGNDSSLALHGTYAINTRVANCSVTGHNIPADLWPPLVEQYPDISGGLNVEGKIYGEIESIHADLDMVFHDMKFLKGGELWNGSAALSWASPELLLKDIHVDGGYSGDAKLRTGSSQLNLGFNVKMEQGNPALVRDILKSTVSISGAIDGDIQGEFKDGLISGQASLDWENGSISSAAFDSAKTMISMNNSKLKLTDLSLTAKNQTLRGYGSLQPAGANLWSYEANLQAQQVGPAGFKLDGEIQAEGDFSVKRNYLKGGIHSSTLWLNGNPLADFRMTIEKSGDTFSTHGAAAPYLDFNGQIAGDTGKIKGSIAGKSLKLNEIISQYFSSLGLKEVPTGNTDVTAKFSGTLSDPVAKVSINIPHAVWRNEGLSAKAFVTVNKSTFTITSSETKLDKGGVLYAGGTIGLVNAREFNIHGAGTDISLISFFHLLNWPLDWKGTANTEFSIKGGMDDKQIKFVFDGQHQGFRPFSGEGALAGSAIWRKGEWDLEGITVEAGNGYIKLLKGSRVFVNKDSSGIMRIVADTRNLRTGPMTYFGGLELAGSWAAEAHTAIEMDVFARSLWVNQVLLNGNVTHLTINRDRLEFSPVITSQQKISGVLDYTDTKALSLVDFRFTDKNEERFYINGKIGHDLWDFSLRTKGVEAALVKGLFDTTLSMSGPMDISMRGLGNVDNPKLIGTILWKNGELVGIPVDLARCNLLLEDGVVYLSKLEAIRKKGYHVEGNLSFGTDLQKKEPEDPLRLDLTLEDGDLAILKDMWPTEVPKSKGSFEGRLVLKDHLEGSLSIKDASMETQSYIPMMKGGVLKLSLENNILNVAEGHARLNHGDLQLTGNIEFDGKNPSLYNLKLNTISETGPSIRIPDLTISPGSVLGKFSVLKQKLGGVSRGDPIINLTLSGTGESPTMAGTVELENTVFTYPPQAKKRTPDNVFQNWLKGFLAKLHWDVGLTAGKRTRYENELVSVPVKGRVRMSGQTSDLSVNGRIEANSGSLVYSGSEFTVNDAVLEIITSTPTFQKEQKETYVYIKARAERQVYYSDALGNGNEDTIVMEVDRSLIGEIQPRFYSKTNPNISPEKALKLALGLDTSDSSNANLPGLNAGSQNQADVDRALRLGLVQLLDSNLATPLARSLARQTGLVDYIRVTYQQNDYQDEASAVQTPNTGSNKVNQNEVLRYVKGTKVKLGREIANRLFADYSFKVDEYQNQVDLRHEVDLAYRLHKNLFIRASSELDTERTLGRPPDRRAVLENQWRFGLPRKKNPLKPGAEIPTPTPTPTEP